MADSVAMRLLDAIAGSQPRRLFLAGPCGVGKSSVAADLARITPGLWHIEHDAIKNRGGYPNPCSKSTFDPEGCFGPLLPDDGEFVCDLGGNSVFFSGTNNAARLEAMRDFKRKHRLTVVVLEAPEATVAMRFRACRPADCPDDVDRLWSEWLDVQRPAWQELMDIWLDAS